MDGKHIVCVGKSVLFNLPFRCLFLTIIAMFKEQNALFLLCKQLGTKRIGDSSKSVEYLTEGIVECFYYTRKYLKH